MAILLGNGGTITPFFIGVNITAPFRGVGFARGLITLKCKIHIEFVIRTMQGPAISVGPFACLEVRMNPIPIAAGILVKVLLEWLLDKE